MLFRSGRSRRRGGQKCGSPAPPHHAGRFLEVGRFDEKVEGAVANLLARVAPSTATTRARGPQVRVSTSCGLRLCPVPNNRPCQAVADELPRPPVSPAGRDGTVDRHPNEPPSASVVWAVDASGSCSRRPLNRRRLALTHSARRGVEERTGVSHRPPEGRCGPFAWGSVKERLYCYGTELPDQSRNYRSHA